MIRADVRKAEDIPQRVDAASLIAMVPLAISVVWLPFESGGSEEFPLLVAQSSTFAVVAWLGLSRRLVRATGETTSLLAVIAVVVGAAVFSTAFSEDLDASVPALLEWLWLAGSALLAIHVARQPRLRELLVGLLAAAVFMQILWGHFVWWGGLDPSKSQVGTFYAANQYAGYLLLLAPIFLGICYAKERLSSAVAFGALSALGYLAVAFSGSRGGAAAAILGMLAMTAAGVRMFGTRVLVRLAGVLLLVVVGGWSLTSALVFPGASKGSGPLTSLEARPQVGASIEMRGRWAEGALMIGSSKPFTGSGPATFGDKFFQIQDPDWQWSAFAHNHYLESLAEGGLFLLLGVALLSAVPLVLGWSRTKEAVGEEQGWRLGLWGGLVGAGAHLAVDHDWSYPAFGVAFLVAAVLVVERSEPVAFPHDAWRRQEMIGALAIGVLLGIMAIVASMALLSGGIFSEMDPLSRAKMAARLAPHSTEPRVVAAALFARRGSRADLHRAVDHLSAASSLDRLDPEILWRRAEAYDLLGEWDAARAAYVEAIRIAPNAPDAYLLAARFALLRNEPRQAIEILDAGISRLGPGDRTSSLAQLRIQVALDLGVSTRELRKRCRCRPRYLCR